MWNLSPENRMRLGSLLAGRAIQKTRDAEIAHEKNRHPNLVDSLQQDADWCREMAAKFLGDEELRG
jgi:hypothetical protein